ncbi:MAG: tetratricopeptide repeat protein, partial [Planctomycetaceae bacterium]|nr:tetratricopeptide repeat protein [Planctomycetaceae bacterium]
VDSVSEEDAEFLLACQYQRDGRPIEALVHFERARSLAPAGSPVDELAAIQIAKCKLAIGRTEVALSELSRVLTVHPQSRDARLTLAEALVHGGRLAEARQVYQSLPIRNARTASQWLDVEYRLAQLQPSTPENWQGVTRALERAEELGVDPTHLVVIRAHLLDVQSEKALARQALDDALQATPDQPELHAALAELLMRDEQYDAARVVLDQAADQFGPHPKTDGAWLMFWKQTDEEQRRNGLAALEQRTYSEQPEQWAALLDRVSRSYLELNDTDGWFRALVGSAEATPDHVGRWFRLIEPSLRLGHADAYDSALNQLQRIEGPQGPYTRIAKAMHLVQQSDPAAMKEARAHVDSAIAEFTEHSSDSQYLYVLGGHIELRLGNTKGAVERYLSAIKFGNQDPQIRLTTAQLLVQLQRAPEALELLKGLGPTGNASNPDLGLNTVRLLSQLQHPKEALEVARGLVEADAANPTARLYLGMLQAAAGDAAAAEREIREATRLAPQEPGGWLALVDLLAERGDAAAANVAVEQAEQALGTDAGSIPLARCYELVGRIDDAEQQFRRALETDSRNATSIDQLAAFYLRQGRVAPAEDALRTILDSPEQFASRDLVAARRRMVQAIASVSFTRFQEALELLEENLREFPDDVTDRRLQATLLLSYPHPEFLRRGLDQFAVVERAATLSPLEMQRAAAACDQLGDTAAADRYWHSVLHQERPSPQAVAAYLRRELNRGQVSGLARWVHDLEQSKLPD